VALLGWQEEALMPSAVRSRLIPALLAHCQKDELLRPGDRVGVAVSGGADSVALLLLLLELREKLGIVLSVVHFNHKLRGKASDADEKFVAQLAEKHGLEFFCGHAAVGKEAKKKRANIEATGREARYGYFRQLAEEGKIAKIAVAHTADDQAETVLAHILRGTGLAGLGGIHPVAPPIFRPLLSFRGDDLRDYLRRMKQKWREDATNQDTSRTRARIRKKLIPLLEKQFQPAVVEHLATLADLAREDEAFFDALLEERMATALQQRDGTAYVALQDLLGTATKKRSNTLFTDKSESTEGTEKKDSAAAMSKRIVRRIVEELKQPGIQLGARHVEAVLELARRAHAGSSLPLPGGVEVRRERDALVFRLRSNAPREKDAREFSYNIDLSHGAQEVPVPKLRCVFRFTAIDWPRKRGETNGGEMFLDRDRLRSPVVLRNWRPGDRLHPLGHRHAHKLKRLLNERRVSRWERDGWPVVTSGGTLAWARGFPVAAEFAAREDTRAAIVIAEEQL
jgi:tRNA(Ile)-lysidine synthase